MDLATLLEDNRLRLLTSVDTLVAARPGASELQGSVPSLLAELCGALRSSRVQPSAWEPFLHVGVDPQRLIDELLIFQRAICVLLKELGASIPANDSSIFAEWFATFVATVSQEQHRRFTAMLDAVPDHVALRGLDGRWAFANSSARRDVEAVVGPTVDIPNLADYEIFDEVMRQFDVDTNRALEGERARSEVQFPTPEGMRWREQHVGPMRASDGRIDGVMFASRDVHAQKVAQGLLARELTFREQTIAVLGHDLRNPLEAIRGLAGLVALSPDVPETVRERVHHIDVAAKRMTEMIKTLTDFAQSRFRGGLPISRQMTRLDELSSAMIEELRISHPRRELRLEVSGEVRGSWDPSRMAQVISNLVGNALRHGDPCAGVLLELRDVGAEVTIEVTSGGPPIPKAVASRIFEPFQQGSTSGETEGLGLGLYIVRQIVDAHQGRVSVRSGEHHNCFVVRLAKNLKEDSNASCLGG